MKTVLFYFGALCVLMVGLASCGPDGQSSNQEVVDGWIAPKLSVLRTEDGVERTFAGNTVELNINDTFSFSGSGTVRETQIHTVCNPENGNWQSSTRAPNSKSFQLKSLLPREALQPKHSTTELKCSFDIKAIGTTGSSRTYTLNANNLVLEKVSTSILIKNNEEEIDTVLEHEAHLLTATNLPSGKGDLELICDQYSQKIATNSKSSKELWDLLKSSFTSTQDQPFDSRKLYPHQQCRLAFVSQQTKMFDRLSKIFTVRFTPPEVVYKVGKTKDDIPMIGGKDRLTFRSLHVHNPSPTTPVTIAFKGNSLTLKMTLRGNGFRKGGTVRGNSFFTIPNHFNTGQIGGKTYVTLQPQEEGFIGMGIQIEQKQKIFNGSFCGFEYDTGGGGLFTVEQTNAVNENGIAVVRNLRWASDFLSRSGQMCFSGSLEHCQMLVCR